MDFGLGGEEEACGHDLLGVVDHDGVEQIEALHILDCGGLGGSAAVSVLDGHGLR